MTVVPRVSERPPQPGETALPVATSTKAIGAALSGVVVGIVVAMWDGNWQAGVSTSTWDVAEPTTGVR